MEVSREIRRGSMEISMEVRGGSMEVSMEVRGGSMEVSTEVRGGPWRSPWRSVGWKNAYTPFKSMQTFRVL